MRKFIKIILLSIVFLFIVTVSEVNAATASITASKTSATVGESVTVTVKIFAATWNVRVSGAGISDTIVGYNEDAVNETKTKSYTLDTSKSGSYTIQISGDATDENDSKIYPSQSVTINVSEPIKQPEPAPPPVENKPTTGGNTNSGGSSNSSTTTKPKQETPKQEVVKSSNSKLDSLQIAEGAITPDFSSSVKEYSITIPNEITKLSISTIADHSKATVRITGNEDLQVGENEINVTVTAEDGSKTTYTILAKRALPELSLQSLAVSYLDGNGIKKELALEPVFSFDIYDYEIKEVLPHTIKELEILAGANRENAKIDILGNKELKIGKNEITVRISVINDAGLEEQKTYKISVKKEEPPVVIEPSTIGKVKTWFSGIGSTISKFISENLNKITTAMLIVATVAFMGLTVYFVYDYKKYNELLAKLAEYNKENLMGRVNVALDPEKAKTEIEEEQNNLLEELFKEEENISKAKIKKGKGKRFKV